MAPDSEPPDFEKLEAERAERIGAELLAMKGPGGSSQSFPVLTIDDLCETHIVHEGRANERTEYKFSAEKACDALLERFHIVSTADETVYVYHAGYYSPDGWDDILGLVHSTAGDNFNRYFHAELKEKIFYATLAKGNPFDKNPYLLCGKNKTIDLRTGEAHDHSPDDFITTQIPVIFDPTAKCPRCVQFFEDVCPNPIDRLTLIDWFVVHAIKKAFPYVMFLLGRGRNGKGVYEDLLQRFYGEENFSNLDLEETKVKNNHFAKDSLKNKTGLIVAEAGDVHKGKKRIQTSFLKLASGDGVIDTDAKNVRKRQRFRPTFKATLDCNDMPEIEDTSKGWAERFLKADLPYYYVDNPDPDNPRERQKNPNLINELSTDEELSGLLNLIIERAKEIIRTGHIIKRPGEELVAEYNIQSQSVRTFLETFCEYTPPRMEEGKLVFVSHPAVLAEVYQAYCDWCEGDNPKDKVDGKRFGASVKRFCDGQKSERDWSVDLNTGRRGNRWYPGFTFQADLCRDVIEGKSISSPLAPSNTIKTPLKSVTAPLAPLILEIWNHIKDVYGTGEGSHDTSIGEKSEKRPFNGANGAAIENSCTIKSANGDAIDFNGAEGPRTGKIDQRTPMSPATMIKQLTRLYDAQGPMTAQVLAQKTGISENFCVSWLKRTKGIDTPEEASTS